MCQNLSKYCEIWQNYCKCNTAPAAYRTALLRTALLAVPLICSHCAHYCCYCSQFLFTNVFLYQNVCDVSSLPDPVDFTCHNVVVVQFIDVIIMKYQIRSEHLVVSEFKKCAVDGLCCSKKPAALTKPHLEMTVKPSRKVCQRLSSFWNCIDNSRNSRATVYNLVGN